MDSQQLDKDLETWRIKRFISTLESMRGNGTSMISLIIPPQDQISRVRKLLDDELGTATNIKSPSNRRSVLSAIGHAQARLKLYNRVPKNGLALFCGTVVTDEGKEKRMNIDLEPFKPLTYPLYFCDSRFHVEPLTELLEPDTRFGFIVMDGHGTLFGTLSGNNREVLHKIQVDLPKKHGRGGQSALRFSRLRDEKRHNYVRRVAELAVQFFISHDRVNLEGLVLAGSADFKTELSQSDLLDARLQAKILRVVDVSYGGENGFNQAIDLASDTLKNVKFSQERKLVQSFFEEIAKDTGKFSYGVHDTMKALEMGAVETLIVWEGLEVNRCVWRDPVSGDTADISFSGGATSEDSQPQARRRVGDVEMELAETTPLIEWLAESYKEFGSALAIVTDKSPEGAQFVRGFGGMGALLRYKVAQEVDGDGEDEFVSDDEFDAV